MDISSGLIAKAVGGTAAVAAASGTSLLYKDEIGSFLFGSHLSEEIIKANEKLDSLGIPSDCRFGAEWSFSACNSIDSDKLKAIKFEGKTEGQNITLSNNIKPSLRVEKLSETDFFTDGLKFIFSAGGDINIPGESNQIILKANTNTEFKIKAGDNSSLTLEKAWNAKTLGEKIGLTCPENGNSGDCSLPSSINVFEDDNKKVTNATITTGSGNGKIKFEENKGGYNQGFKFYIDGSEINLNGTTSDIKKLKEFATYEIKEHDEGSGKKWYLTKRSAASKEIAKILKLPERCVLPTNNNEPKNCTISNKKDLKKINFEGKSSSNGSDNDSINVSLKIEKTNETNNYPQGYKFIFKSSDNAVNIPKNGSGQITINTTDTEFKIKKSGSSLTLEEKTN